MSTQQSVKEYQLPIKSLPFRNEGPRAYLLRLAETNLLTSLEMDSLGITYDYDLFLSQGLLDAQSLDPDLHAHVQMISHLWRTETRVWNRQFARYCPQCLSEHGHWKVEWELNFYDVCHHHQVYLVDQCSSCGKKLTWNRSQVARCSCGSILSSEQAKLCPESMVAISQVLSTKILRNDSSQLPTIFRKTNVEQSQRLIRYVGNYMSLASGKNPLKMRQVGDLNHSWTVTSLCAEV